MLATKFASSSSAHTTHVPRARISQRREIRPEDVREDKGCNGVPGGDLIGVLLVSATAESFPQKEGLNDPGARFDNPQPEYTISPSRKRYDKRYERLDDTGLRGDGMTFPQERSVFGKRAVPCSLPIILTYRLAGFEQNKKAFIQSRQPREAGVVVQERRSCPVSSARPVLVVATRAATRCLRAARGPVVDCENASPGGGHASPRRSAVTLVPG